MNPQSPKKPTVNVCVRCEAKFIDWNEYHKHITGPKCELKTIPWKQTKS